MKESIESVERAGFVADVALARLHAQVARLVPRVQRATAKSSAKGKCQAVLLVDDFELTEELGQALQEMLPKGATVTVSTNAREAMELVQDHPWKVAVLDLHLGDPDITGLDLLAHLDASTEVVLVTGRMLEDLPEIQARARVAYTLSKPFPPKRLAEVVTELLLK